MSGKATTLICLQRDKGGILVLAEEGSALSVLGRSSAPANLAASPGGNGDNDSHDEENGHDDKGKDPLEGNDLSQELRDTDGSGEHAKRESHGVILIDVSFDANAWTKILTL